MDEIKKIAVICRHNVGVRSMYNGAVQHVIIFYDPDTHISYEWTTSSDSGLRIQPGHAYIISAKITDENIHKIARVEWTDIGPNAEVVKEESEQDEKLDALDILLGRTCYVLDKRLKLIYNDEERSE